MTNSKPATALDALHLCREAWERSQPQTFLELDVLSDEPAIWPPGRKRPGSSLSAPGFDGNAPPGRGALNPSPLRP